MTHDTAMPEDRWKLLGALLIQRRTALDPRYHNRTAFAEATGLNYRVIYDIEEARRTNFGNSTLAAIEVAYQLQPGSIARYLAGGELEAAASAEPGPAAEDETIAQVFSLLTDKYEREIAEMKNVPLERKFELIRMLREAREKAAQGEPGTGRQRR